MLAAFALGALLGMGGAAPSNPFVPPAASYVRVANAASTIPVNDEVHLTLDHETASEDLIESGLAKGTLPGHVNAVLNVGVDVRISFTLHPRGGTVSGHGVAKIHGKGTWISYTGPVFITRCTGRFKRMHGGGQVYGILNRETDDSTVQVIGKLVG